MKLYMIDGVEVPLRIYLRRQVFGEHAEAKFEALKVVPKEPPFKKRRSY